MKAQCGKGFRRLVIFQPGRRIIDRLVPVLVLLLLPGLLGAWKVISGETINPQYVERIKDGVTKKHEILLYFGDPKEIKRTEYGPVYKYMSYKDAPAMPYRPENREINPQSASDFMIDENKQIKKPKIKTEGKILRSSLTIRFHKDGDTVMSHEYKEF
ncbi:MAG TPA: hypothetical protein VIN67_05185 [Desulfobaccales bacterium]